MQTMYKIIGWSLGLFFILCGAGAMTDGAWPAAALFMIAGFIAIPLPNKQLQALGITPWPGLALSFVVAGIAMWLAVSASPPLPIEKADKNFKAYDAGHTKGIPLFAERNVGELTIFSEAKTYEERIHTVLYAAKRYLEQEDLKYVRVFHLSYPHEALIGAGAVIAKGEYAPDGKGGDGSGPLAHKTWQASAVKGEVDEVEAMIEVLWNQMRDRYQVTHESGTYTYTDEPALKQAISEAIKGSIPPDEIGLPTYHLVDYEPGAASAPAEEIKPTRPARALEQAQTYTILEVEDYPAPQGKGRYKVTAYSENAQTFEQRAQTAIQIAVDWHNKTQAYEILVWLEILPELSARVAIADYYPLNVTAWGKNPPYQLQVEAANYQAGMNGEYEPFDIILRPYNFNPQQATAP